MSVPDYERSHVRRIVERISENVHKRIVAITGPRQTGKTTIALQVRQHLIKSQIPCWYIPVDNPNNDESDWHEVQHTGDTTRIEILPHEQILVDIWTRARQACLKSKQGLVLILDEVQLIPRWSNIMKGLWDDDKRKGVPLRVVILGSAAWKLLVGRNESLAGRFDALPVTHWTLREMKKGFGISVEEYLFFGGYPSGLIHTDLADWQSYILDSILTPVIDRDIVGLERIRKPALMRQLMDLAPGYSGQIITYNKLLGQLQDAGNATTIADYLEMLSGAGLVVALSPYTVAPHLGRARSPKLIVLNTAFMTAASGYSFQEAKADRSFWGHIVESAVGAHLYNTRATATKIHFWRDKKGHEVDFVIQRGPHLVGVEVKSGRMRSRSGLDAFEARFPDARTMVAGAGQNGISLNEFFSLTADEWIDELKQ